jgi:cytochrome P450
LAFYRNPVAFMSKLYQDFGPLVRLSPGNNGALFFKSRIPGCTFFALGTEFARDLLSQPDKFQTRQPPAPETPTFRRLATNIFFTNGERHRQQRQLFMPAFTRESLKAYYSEMIGLTESCLDSWEGQDLIQVDQEMSRLTLNIGSKIFYGIDATVDRSSLAHLMSDMIFMLFSPVTMIPIDLPGTPYRRLIRISEQIEAAILAEVEKKRRTGYQGADLLTAMVKKHDEDPEQLTADELVGQAFTMFFAGHDTASKALAWTLFLIAQHPDVAAELQDELEGLGGEPPSYEQIYQLEVLDRVIKESLRVCPPAVVFSREAVADAVLGGVQIPEGSEVLYSPYVIHKDPANFERPDRFDPSRWLNSNPTRYQYLPYGVGARTCLGVSFGGLQLRLLIALILQRYRLEVIPNTRIDLKTNVVISPKPGLPMRLRRQDRQFSRSRAPVRGYINKMVEL